MNKLLFCLLFPILPALAHGDIRPPTPEMFAYGSSLELHGDGPFYYCDLPLEIYRSVSRPDLGDLRVFNGLGQVVPHALKRPDLPTTYNRSLTTATIPFFPLTAKADQELADLNMHVEKTASGTIIDVRTGSSDLADQEKKTVGYLLDTQQIDARLPRNGGPYEPPSPSSLELEWSDAQNDFLGKIMVETSRDLIAWQPLTTATLARMNHQGYRLDRKNISLPRGVHRYLRLTWPGEQPAILLTRVTAQASRSTLISGQHKLTWLTAEIRSDRSGFYMVDLGVALPIERLRVKLSDRNTMAVAAISSAPAQDGPFSREWEGLLYHLVSGEERLENPGISVRPQPRRYWRISFPASEVGPPSPPIVECGWQPDQLLFLAQGDAPFRVFYGSADIKPADSKMNNLLARYQNTAGRKLTTAVARVGPRFIQGGEARLKPRPQSPPWRKYILWLVLSSGVALIGWMSLSLYHQLQTVDNKGKAA